MQVENKLNKDAVRGQALATNPGLKKIRQELIEIEGLYSRIMGIRNAYKALYDAVSRVVALRSTTKEMI